MGSLLPVSFSRSPLPVLEWWRSLSADTGQVARRPAISTERRSLRLPVPFWTQIRLRLNRGFRNPIGWDGSWIEGLPWASDVRRATGKTAAAVVTTLCPCDVRMTISSMSCRRCLKRLRPLGAMYRHLTVCRTSCRSRRRMPGFARLRSGYRTSSGTCPFAGGRTPRDPAATRRDNRRGVLLADPRGHRFCAKRAAPATGASHFTA